MDCALARQHQTGICSPCSPTPPGPSLAMDPNQVFILTGKSIEILSETKCNQKGQMIILFGSIQVNKAIIE